MIKKHFRVLLLLVFTCILASGPLLAQLSMDVLADARDVRVRRGLPNIAQKLEAKEPVKVAYFGGSITEAKGGWREQSLAQLRQLYPAVSFQEINAAIGGTGSDLGAFRLQQHVLDHRPDLVLVEFAVNDNEKAPEDVIRSMEGIIRQVWNSNAHTDICFVYTLMASMAPVLEQGKLPVSASAMERVADYYGIPSVHLGLEVVELARQGKLEYRGKPEDWPDKLVFSPDNVHPYPQTGHALYAKAFVKALPALLSTHSGWQHNPGPPLDAQNYERVAMLPATQVEKSLGWRVLTPENDTVAHQLRHRFRQLIKANQPGEKLSFRFKGTQIGLYDVMGPGCGQYEVSIDGAPFTLISRFDEYCTYYRSNYFLLPRLAGGEHRVEFRIASAAPDKEAILRKRNTVMEGGPKYAENACYAAELLLVGEILP
ncbi:SGNH/GDSL hydrolase family protein [Telluribacter humicola]|uniref:SGNH/GDSL hydrolase family protein n=1 Tax=Telluribacter humicola TaxID=1720261 RepID=UPI001A95CBB6|nr:SGNH/GDSL hydrolase family protein [Telluribacter humicola]